MGWFTHRKIMHKLIIAFSVVLFFFYILGGFALYRLSKVNDSTIETSQYLVPSVQSSLQLQLSTLHIASLEQQAIQAVNLDATSDVRKALLEELSLAKNHIESLKNILQSEEERTLLNTIETDYLTFLNRTFEALHLIDNANMYDGIDILKKELPNVITPMTALQKTLHQHITNDIDVINQRSMTTYHTSFGLIVSLLIATFLISCLVIFYLARTISRPLKEASALADRVAQGDLTAEITVSSQDEVGQLMLALQMMNHNLRTVVNKIQQGTDTLYQASDDITQGNMNLSERTEKQVQSLDQTAIEIKQLTETVKHNAESAQQADALATHATKIATQGGDMMEKVVNTMHTISESSHQIESIISVIDGIAFQTNILALNAAVEAARAGEQGKGFAVVATEVRNLAQRSASAAKEINTLIHSSVQDVSIGNDLAQQAGSTMQEIVKSIEHVTQIVSEITTASHDQRNGIEHIQQAIQQMEEFTHHNTALTQQATSAAKEMHHQTVLLEHTVGAFHLNNRTHSALPNIQPTLSMA